MLLILVLIFVLLQLFIEIYSVFSCFFKKNCQDRSTEEVVKTESGTDFVNVFNSCSGHYITTIIYANISSVLVFSSSRNISRTSLKISDSL